MAFEVVCCMMSWDSSVYNHLKPIAIHPSVSRLWIVRPKQSSFGEIPKTVYALTPSRLKILRWIKMGILCFRLGYRREVKAFVSFNPVPYGLIAYAAAKWHKKPIHLGFIGADWYKYSKGILKSILLPLYHKADMITATGKPMKEEMISYGINENDIVLLPHPIDIDRFLVCDPAKARYTCVFVGELIHRKRVDLILDSFSKVIMKFSDARLCIVGDGPLKTKLKQQAEQLGISENVNFVGFKSNVQQYLADAKIIVIASDSEGFPFSLVEGICSGLVPVSTPVGTITDVIKNGINGLLFPKGDVSALTEIIMQLIESPALYNRIRSKTLELRKQYSYETATAVWDNWLRSMNDHPKCKGVNEL